MSIDAEEWRAEVRSMTEVQRELAADEERRALGLCGEKYDEMYGGAA